MAVDANGVLTPPTLVYIGTVRSELDQIVMEFRSLSHSETPVYRFLNRIPSNASVIPGIWLSYDHDNNPAAGVAIISRELLNDDAARLSLQQWSAVDRTFATIHIRDKPAPRRQTSDKANVVNE